MIMLCFLENNFVCCYYCDKVCAYLTYRICFLSVCWIVERLALIKEQRAEAAKKREEEKLGTFLFFFLYLNTFFLSVEWSTKDSFACGFLPFAAKESKKIEGRK